MRGLDLEFCIEQKDRISIIKCLRGIRPCDGIACIQVDRTNGYVGLGSQPDVEYSANWNESNLLHIGIHIQRSPERKLTIAVQDGVDRFITCCNADHHRATEDRYHESRSDHGSANA